MKERFRWIIILVSVFMIISLSQSVVDLWQRKSIVQQEQDRLATIEKKHEELAQKLEYVQTPMFVEKEARERLGMAKEGDTIILMGDVSQTDASRGVANDTSGDGVPDQIPNWKRWWMVFH